MKNRNDEIKTYKKRLIGATGKVIDRNRKTFRRKNWGKMLDVSETMICDVLSGKQTKLDDEEIKYIADIEYKTNLLKVMIEHHITQERRGNV